MPNRGKVCTNTYYGQVSRERKILFSFKLKCYCIYILFKIMKQKYLYTYLRPFPNNFYEMHTVSILVRPVPTNSFLASRFLFPLFRIFSKDIEV